MPGPHEFYQRRDLIEAWVSAKEFVASKPRERDFQSELSRRSANEIRVDPVGRRLVHRRKKVFKRVLEMTASDPNRLMFSSVSFSHLLGQRRLVVRCTFVL